jgi:hypothetical protein
MLVKLSGCSVPRCRRNGTGSTCNVWTIIADVESHDLSRLDCEKGAGYGGYGDGSRGTVPDRTIQS